MTRIIAPALTLALALGLVLGCGDDRTKTQKMADAIKENSAKWKEKAAAGLAKLKAVKTGKDFTEAAKEQQSTIQAKIDELSAKLKEANPDPAMKAKIEEQTKALKASLGELETVIAEASKDPEKTWESLKAKAIAAMEKAEKNLQQQP